ADCAKPPYGRLALFHSGEHTLPACGIRPLAECSVMMHSPNRNTVRGKLQRSTGWQTVLPGLEIASGGWQMNSRNHAAGAATAKLDRRKFQRDQARVVS